MVFGFVCFSLFFLYLAIQNRKNLEIVVVFHTKVLSGLKTCNFINRFYCVVRV